MLTSNKLTDRAALKQQRQRLGKLSSDLFLFQTASDELSLRLKDINRSFNNVAVVTGHPDYWNSKFPMADIYLEEETIAFKSNNYDLIVHPMALHWSNDPVGQLIQCRFSMLQDGLLLAVCFGGETLTELRAVLLHAETELYGGASPRVAPMASVRDYGVLLQRAGFALPVTDRMTINTNYSSINQLGHDLRAMAETNALSARRRKFSSNRLFELADKLYRNSFANADGRLEVTFELVFLTGWTPSENQQQPLRPGTAQSRLADALKTDEYKI